jgi:CheY-like chemotaxis protein
VTSDLRILVVDDDPLLLPALGRTLRSWGYEAATAHSAEEALTALHHQSADVVIADFILPGMDGVALLEWVAKRFPDTTGILMSGSHDEAIARASKNSAVAGFVGKPIDPAALASIIALSAGKLPSSAHQEPPTPSEGPMVKLARLAGGVSHDLAAALVRANRAVDDVACTMSPDDPRRDGLAEAKAALDEARGTLTRLSRFADRDPVDAAHVELNEFAGELPRLLGGVLSDTIVLVVTPSAEPCAIAVDQALLEHVLIDLAVRARQRLPKGGQVRINLKGEPGGKWAEMSIEDDGPEEPASFEPYARFGAAAGIGDRDPLRLADCHGTVGRLGGSLRASDDGRTLVLRLPVATS